MAILNLCKNCGIEFAPYRNSKGIFCSRKCCAIWKTKNGFIKIGGRTSTTFKKGHLFKGVLGRLHTEKTKEKIRLAKLGKKLIRSEEGKKSFREKMSGANNSNWKGGTQSKNRLERVKFQRTIQKQIFERDNYTCQLCGIRGIDLQVDHIQEWSKYIEGRFDINNCRTLCAKCHYKITFGKEMPETVKGWGHNLLERERVQLFQP